MNLHRFADSAPLQMQVVGAAGVAAAGVVAAAVVTAAAAATPLVKTAA